jgi:hypothetical protein
MSDTTDDPGRDPEGGNRDVQPGGRASRGPNPQPGGEEEPGGLVPPYDDRTGENTDSSGNATT